MKIGIKGHIPVLLNEVLKALAPKDNNQYLDCTFGGGGHARAILEAAPKATLIAIDQDPSAAERFEEFKKEFGNRVKFYGISFGELDQIEESNFAGILFDIGVSSFQLDEATRGFSFRFDAELDLRMNPRVGQPAWQFLEKASKEELIKAIRDLGEEQNWKKVVQRIINARGKGILKNTKTFAQLVADAIGNPHGKPMKINPATKTFQGIRMAINNELQELEQALPKAFEKLVIGGILAVISFHSLEDRIVKRFFRRMAGKPEHSQDSVPQDLRKSFAEILTPRPVVALEQEIQNNPRSRSAKLRILRKAKKTIL